MTRSFADERIKRVQHWISLWLAIHKPLIEMVQVYGVLSPVQDIINASADSSEEANPHLGCTIREVIVTGAERGHPNGHVRADGIIPIHRETTVDSLLAAFCVQCVVQLDSHILQATTLVKIGNSLTDAS
jgi:hypothetical protein